VVGDLHERRPRLRAQYAQRAVVQVLAKRARDCAIDSLLRQHMPKAVKGRSVLLQHSRLQCLHQRFGGLVGFQAGDRGQQ
jgi:hypothetical protein